MKIKNILLSIILITIVTLCGIGIGYGVYLVNLHDSDKEIDIDNSNNSVLVTRDSIKELAKNNKYIDDNFDDKIYYFVSYDKNTQINNQDVFLLLEDGKVYLYSNSYSEYDSEYKWVEKPGVEYKSLISNISGNVVMIKELVTGGCVGDHIEYGLLTDEGNLYVIKVSDNMDNSNSILSALSKNKDVSLTIRTTTNAELKVLAFTTYSYDERFNTCSRHASPLYVSDNNLRDYETYEVVKPIIDYTFIYGSNNISRGFVVYEDKTISIDNLNIVKNINNDNLLIQYYFNDMYLSTIFIIDNNNNLYYQDVNDNNKIVNIEKELIDEESSSYVIFTLTFVNNEVIKLKTYCYLSDYESYYEYMFFE